MLTARSMADSRVLMAAPPWLWLLPFGESRQLSAAKLRQQKATLLD
jgi:hypothetical protein